MSATDLLPAGMSDDFYKAEFLRRFGEERAVRDAIDDPVLLSLRAFLEDETPGAKETWKFSKDGHGESIPVMEEILHNLFEIWFTPQKNESGAIRLSKRYIALSKTESKERIGEIVVYEVVDGVFRGGDDFIPFAKGRPSLSYTEKQRRGLLLYAR